MRLVIDTNLLVSDVIAARLGQTGMTTQGIVDDLRRLAVVVLPMDVPRVVLNDPDDDQVIAVAVERLAASRRA